MSGTKRPFSLTRVAEVPHEFAQSTGSEARMRTGKEIILATKPYAIDSSARSWRYLFSTAFLLASAVAGTLWNFHFVGKVVCSILAGLLYLRFFVIYHDQQH